MNTQIKNLKVTCMAIATGALVLAACNSSDYSKKEGDGTATTVMSTDTSNAMNNNTAASTMNSTTATDTTSAMNSTGAMDGTAKADPAKKGKKGKVSVMEQKAGSNVAMTADNNGVYNSAEILPAYPGGSNSLSRFFNDNITYPQTAMDEGVEGTVNVNFAVDENGKLSNAKIIGKKAGYGFDEEALRVVNQMPTWTPGRIKGKNVKTYYTLPVSFQLY